MFIICNVELLHALLLISELFAQLTEIARSLLQYEILILYDRSVELFLPPPPFPVRLALLERWMVIVMPGV